MTDISAPPRLIGGHGSGTSSPSARRRRQGTSAQVSAYDFRRPINLSREKARILELCFESFARQGSTVLTSALRSVCQVELRTVGQVSYAEYVETLGDLTYMAVCSVDPLPEPAIVETPLDVTMTCIDSLLGGPGTVDQPQRPLTDLERAVVTGLYDRLVAELRHAFETLVPLEPAIVAVEYNPQLAQVAGASDPMVVARFSLRMREREYPLSVAMAFPGLLPFLNAAESSDVVSDRDRARRQEASVRLASGLQEIPVDVSVRFRSTPVEPMELVGLQLGDVVRLRHPSQAPLDVTAADVVFAHATPGSQGQRLAALVVAPATQENS
ncbi:MAG: flagellar motor switch protein FliM [Nocardioidaceae bacterium]